MLDEGTNALDNLTENEVMQAINNLKSQTTIVIVTHRLTTLKQVDHIFVVDDGRIIAQGNYEELSKTNSFFSSQNDES